MGISWIDGNRLKLFLILLVLSLSLHDAIQERRPFRKMNNFERLLVSVSAPAQFLLAEMRHRVNTVVERYVWFVGTVDENKRLHKQVADLEETLFQLKELQRENIRLKRLLKFGEEIKGVKVLARVIGKDSTKNFNVLRINKGQDDGVYEKSVVVTELGLVGHVFRAGNGHADILTILDYKNRVDAVVDRTRTHGIVVGEGNGELLMKYVPRTDAVAIDDWAITSGLSSIYPKGIRVGQIHDINKKNYGITQDVYLLPSVDFDRLEEVIVLVKKDTLIL